MTYGEALKFCREAFEKNGIENSGNESRWLLESIDDGFMLKLRDEMDSEDMDEYFSLAQRRVNGEPLQYLIGYWEFYGFDYFVGEGVLIPRSETEMLVDYALDVLKDIPDPVVIDLCAGSGCIGLTVAQKLPKAKVYLAEKYDDAYFYLEKNARNIKNAVLIKGDIFDDLDLPRADLILSNPPYINSDEISSLQKEVQFEPATALDGGEDGLMFYRRIAQIAKENGCPCLAVECGENQSEEIERIFSFFNKTESLEDFNQIKRIVTAGNR